MELTLENILGIVMILIGLSAFWFTAIAKGKFQEGSELKTITKSYIPVIFFLMCFSLWHVVREVFHWKETYGEAIEYPEYLFISLAYIMLFRASRILHNIAKKLGITE